MDKQIENDMKTGMIQLFMGNRGSPNIGCPFRWFLEQGLYRGGGGGGGVGYGRGSPHCWKCRGSPERTPNARTLGTKAV